MLATEDPLLRRREMFGNALHLGLRLGKLRVFAVRGHTIAN